ncbi:DHA2 family efflux MFS transporter permease subunit [Rosenbergiella australiborealis]|uniref:DHA2 family efflux MFS transporter permease subunit n=1 Tax=Rosenbergiella australiborealis TaxID=1544696 RepID=A0ABS5TA60_9GAMM|nr:DHA2 family efflux MFS transporter permease subunit [Rosenbergiella australiborealis]MBT0727843.1 DHA2 family efflux MFS transporter permease subunit [Rosenbergiella australiborealis]
MVRSTGNLTGLPWIAAMAFFMQALDATILNTALPAIAQSLHRSPLAMQSTIISYSLTVAMLIPVSGWLADRCGTRKVFISAVTLFALGSLACALSQSLCLLVISRVVQGIGGAMMMPVARLTLLKAYPRNELLPILNFVTMPGLLGPVLGPVLGGFFVTYATWHWIFLINIPIALVGIFFARKYMPDFTVPKRKFDLLGFLLFSGSIVAISTGVELLGEEQISLGTALVTIVLGLLLLAFYIKHAFRYATPLINLSMFRIRTFSVGIAGNVASRLGTGCIPFLIPLLLQVAFGYSAIFAGFIMIATAVGAVLAKSTVTPLLRRQGYRRTLVGISMIIGLLIMSFALQSNQRSILWLLPPLFLIGMAMSTQFTSMNTITLADLTDEYASGGNSVLAVTQQLAISLGVSVSAAVLRFWQGYSSSTQWQFQATFTTMGIVTIIAGCIFLLLMKKDGENLIKRPARKR